jgi:hypothetical protein
LPLKLYRSSCKLCKNDTGLLTIKDYTFENTLSRNNKVYLKKVSPYIFNSRLENSYGLVRITSIVSKKNSTTWGMANNSWAIYILPQPARERPDIYEGDRVVVYGIIASYNRQLASGLVKNQNALWVSNAKSDIVRLYIEYILN